MYILYAHHLQIFFVTILFDMLYLHCYIGCAVVVACFFEDHENILYLIMKAYPDVLFMPSTDPA